jgi:hypothetical protein
MIALDTNTYQHIFLCMMRLEKVAVFFQKKLVGSSSELLGEIADLLVGRSLVMSYVGRILKRLRIPSYPV